MVGIKEYYILQTLNKKKNILCLSELTKIVNDIENIRMGFRITVTDIITGQVTDDESREAVTRAVGITSRKII